MMTELPKSPWFRRLFWLLTLIAIFAAFWPFYRAFFHFEIDINEGWNAYFDDAAMGAMPLYPARDKLITNNYPPLSFYITGALGWLIHDTVLAGRLLSLAAVVVIALGIAKSIKLLGGDGTAAWIGGMFYSATVCVFFTNYVGMNDPHLLGQAFMVTGFMGFLRAVRRGNGFAWPILTMVCAGFIKHNQIVLPITAFIWLGAHRPRQCVKCGILAVVAVAVGFALCFAAFGGDFFANLLAPRAWVWRHAYGAIGHLQYVSVGLLCSLYVGFVRRDDPTMKLFTFLILFSLANFFLQKVGDGVGENAQFDLLVAVSIGVGLAFALAPTLPLARRIAPAQLQTLFLFALCCRLLALTTLDPVRVWTDPDFHVELVEREQVMAQTVTVIRATNNVVFASPLACYWAGKPFLVDPFNVNQRILAGQLPADALIKLVSKKENAD
jgi:hypothetical protein